MQLVNLALTTAALVAAAPAPAPAKSFNVPLRRRTLQARSDGTADVGQFLHEFNKTLIKYKAKEFIPARFAEFTAGKTSLLGKRGSSATDPLTDQADSGGDELYYGPIVVGNSGTFTVDFDTGSSDLFLPGPSCPTSQCPGKHYSGGVDRGNTTMVTYGSGAISGENRLDNVSIQGLTVKNQNVVALTTAQGFADSNADGLMGAAFNSIANSGSPTWFSNAVSQGVLAADYFAFRLGRAASGTQGISELVIGAKPSDYSGPVTSVKVNTQTYWEVPLDGIGKNGAIIPGTSGATFGAIDSGTTIYVADLATAEAFALATNSIPIQPSGIIVLFATPCHILDNTPITAALGGKQFRLNPKDLNLGTLSPDVIAQLGVPSNVLTNYLEQNTGLGGFCLSAIGGAELDPTTRLSIVGDTFFKSIVSDGANNKGYVGFKGINAPLGVSAVEIAATPYTA
ncbi:hypothetical protein PYCC9005_003107 [Savitreella phatthalungensis]